MKSKTKYSLLAMCLSIALLAVGCASRNMNLLRQNLSFMYNANTTSFHPGILLINSGPDSTKVFIRLKKDELTANTQSGETNYAYSIAYLLYNEYEKPLLLDSASLGYRKVSESESKMGYFHDSFIITNSAKTAVLVIRISDHEKKVIYSYIRTIDRIRENNRQSFTVTNPYGDLIFTPYCLDAETVLISLRGTSAFNVSYFGRDFSQADPPFVLNKSKETEISADSQFTYQSGTPFQQKKKGIYFFSTTVNEVYGLSLFSFYNGFPSISSSEHMLGPLRYLTAKKEYDEMANGFNIKQEVDRFWFELAGSEERAKVLIRSYYNRVIESNLMFSSYKEGWKTDRGMIYTVFGEPDNVFRSNNGESWTYGAAGHIMSISFTFLKIQNPLSDNDYQLSRSPIYQDNWIMAVDYWRSGRPYND